MRVRLHNIFVGVLAWIGMIGVANASLKPIDFVCTFGQSQQCTCSDINGVKEPCTDNLSALSSDCTGTKLVGCVTQTTSDGVSTMLKTTVYSCTGCKTGKLVMKQAQEFCASNTSMAIVATYDDCETPSVPTCTGAWRLVIGANYEKCSSSTLYRCQAGYYGSQEIYTSVPTDCKICTRCQYSIAGQTSCSTPPQGTYTNVCADGNTDGQGGTVENTCESGYYCIVGTRYKCPPFNDADIALSCYAQNVDIERDSVCAIGSRTDTTTSSLPSVLTQCFLAAGQEYTDETGTFITEDRCFYDDRIQL